MIARDIFSPAQKFAVGNYKYVKDRGYAFEEKLRGTIEVGKLADLTVLSADIMKIPEAEILQTKCAMTVIGGEVVFEVAGKK